MKQKHNPCLPDIREIQKRVAYVSIGPSTLRNQGDKGVANVAQHYLMVIDLSHVSKMENQNDYLLWLNKMTNELKEQFPGRARGNWGAARKAINVFMEEAFYNKYLNNCYQLDKIAHFLEVPVDSYVINNLKKELNDAAVMPKWISIKKLKENDHEIIQGLANKIAEKKSVLRVFLDLKWWRS